MSLTISWTKEKKLFSILYKDELHCQLTCTTLPIENIRNKKRIGIIVKCNSVLIPG